MMLIMMMMDSTRTEGADLQKGAEAAVTNRL